ncbi:putative ribonuclease H-like domain-containing protein [Tanacetum coccineum]
MQKKYGNASNQDSVGNVESKRLQKVTSNAKFEGFIVSTQMGLKMAVRDFKVFSVNSSFREQPSVVNVTATNLGHFARRACRSKKKTGGGMDWNMEIVMEQNGKKKRKLVLLSVEIKAYTQGLKKVEAQLVAHQQGQLWFGPVALRGSSGYISGKGKIPKLQCQNSTTKWSAGDKEQDLIEAARRAMLADSFLPNTFWVKKFSTACMNSLIEEETDQGLFEYKYGFYSSTNKSSSKSDGKRGSPREEKQNFLDDLARLQIQEKEANEEAEALRKNLDQETEILVTQGEAAKSSSTNIFSTVSQTSKASGTNLVNTGGTNHVSTDTTDSQEDDSEIPPLEDIHEDATDGIFTHSSYDDEGAVADFTNLETIVNVSPIPTSRINPSHPSELILGDPTSAVQTRSKLNKSSETHAFFEIQKVWILVDLPYGKKAIDLEAIRIFLSFCLIYGFIVYQKDVKCAFLYGKIDEEVICVSTHQGFLDTKSPRKVLSVLKLCMDSISPRAIGYAIIHFLVKEMSVLVLGFKSLKTSHLTAVKRIFSDYAGANLDRKSTTGGCQFLGRRLITWQCKKQTIVATSTTEAEYVAAASSLVGSLMDSKSMLDLVQLHEHKDYIDNERPFAL